MSKEITYTEPASYFNADMKKAAKAWEDKQKAAKKEVSPKPKKGK